MGGLTGFGAGSVRRERDDRDGVSEGGTSGEEWEKAREGTDPRTAIEECIKGAKSYRKSCNGMPRWRDSKSPLGDR